MTSSKGPSRQSSVESEGKSAGLSKFLFSRQSSRRKAKSSPAESRKSEPGPAVDDEPSPSTSTASTLSRGRRLAEFSRSLRKKQWHLFKHRTFFGSQSSKRTKGAANQLQLPRLTLRHPSVDESAMPLTIDGDESEFLTIRTSQRRWTEEPPVAERCYRVHSDGRLRDSRESSGFNDSQDLLDDASGVMTAPVSPCVPLSSSSSHSDGWKYNSQRLLFKFKNHRLGHISAFSHTSSTSSSTDSAWKSLDSNTWRHSLDDKEVTLRGAQLETLSDVERSALQIVAAQRLSKVLPGISLSKNKDAISLLKQKRQKLIKTSRTLTTGDVSRRPSACDEDKRIFGVSLVDCMQNEHRLDLESRCRSLDDSAVITPRTNKAVSTNRAKSVRSEPEFINVIDEKKWLYPSHQSVEPTTSSHPSSPSPLIGSAPTTYSLPVRESSLPSSSHPFTESTGRFIKKQRPSSASFSYSLDGAGDDVDPHTLRVPRIVENCTQYILTYGLNTVGLFRVAGNTKRCRQLRIALEKVAGCATIGDDMVTNMTPHDVATLLKEYFRDLPQSLLPKEHYKAYMEASKLGLEDRIEASRLLVSLLPPPAVDTLFVLLKFLHEVAENSNDRQVEGETVVGNRMDARNLATIFAPCILRPDHDKLHATLADSENQILIVETMITHVEEVFKIPKELQCNIYNKLREIEPTRLDRVLDQIARADGYQDHLLPSPFPATVEEDSPREGSLEKTVNGKPKVTSQRSGSWPYSLPSTRNQQFFPNDDSACASINSCPLETEHPTECSAPSPSTFGRAPDGVASSPGSARATSRERDYFRSAARSGAAAARRRLRNVVRAFRFSSIARSTPNVVEY